MGTNLYTRNGDDRFLVYEIVEYNDFEDAERFVGYDLRKTLENQWLLSTTRGPIPLRVGDFIVFINASEDHPIYLNVGDDVLEHRKSTYEVYSPEAFALYFKEVTPSDAGRHVDE